MFTHVFVFLLLQPFHSDKLEVPLPSGHSVLIISEDGIGENVERHDFGVRLEVRPRLSEDKDQVTLAMKRTGRLELVLLAEGISRWPDDGWWFLDFDSR